jgi:putative transposase
VGESGSLCRDHILRTRADDGFDHSLGYRDRLKGVAGPLTEWCMDTPFSFSITCCVTPTRVAPKIRDFPSMHSVWPRKPKFCRMLTPDIPRFIAPDPWTTLATVNFLLTAKRDRKAALRFFCGRSSGTARRRRSRSTGVAPTRWRSKAITSKPRRASRSVRSNTLTISSNRIIKPSSGWYGRCRGSSPSGRPQLTLAGIKLMHMIRKVPSQARAEVCPARQFYALAG